MHAVHSKISSNGVLVESNFAVAQFTDFALLKIAKIVVLANICFI